MRYYFELTRTTRVLRRKNVAYEFQKMTKTGLVNCSYFGSPMRPHQNDDDGPFPKGAFPTNVFPGAKRVENRKPPGRKGRGGSLVKIAAAPRPE